MKTFYFIRHGESESNAARHNGTYSNTSRFIDPPLTSKGIEQSKNLCNMSLQWNIEHVVVSPLQRSYQTADCIFGDQTIPCSIFSRVREIYWRDAENRGANFNSLRRQFSRLKLYSTLQQESLELLENGLDQYWQPDIENTMKKFGNVSFVACESSLSILYSLPYERIAIITHSQYIYSLFGIDTENCDVIQVVLNQSHLNSKFGVEICSIEKLTDF